MKKINRLELQRANTNFKKALKLTFAVLFLIFLIKLNVT